jgi:hypothetical protein
MCDICNTRRGKSAQKAAERTEQVEYGRLYAKICVIGGPNFVRIRSSSTGSQPISKQRADLTRVRGIRMNKTVFAAVAAVAILAACDKPAPVVVPAPAPPPVIVAPAPTPPPAMTPPAADAMKSADKAADAAKDAKGSAMDAKGSAMDAKDTSKDMKK